jgi:hypothetical protein
MNVKGKKFHCTTCQSVVAVDYTGGTQPTQVSDPVIWRQNEVRTALGIQDDEDHYLHTVGLCEACAEKRFAEVGDDATPFEVIERLEAAVDALHESASKHGSALSKIYEEALHRCLHTLTLKDLEEVAPEAFAQTFKSKLYRLTNKRPQLIEEFLRAAKMPMDQTIDGLLDKDQELGRALASFKSEIARSQSACIEAINQCRPWWYGVHKMSAPENLNPYIQTEDTVRWPIDGTPDKLFIFEHETDKKGISDHVNYLADAQRFKPGSETISKMVLAKVKLLADLD